MDGAALPRAAPDPWQFAALPDRRRGRDPAPAGLRERRAEPGSGPDRDEALRRGRPRPRPELRVDRRSLQRDAWRRRRGASPACAGGNTSSTRCSGRPRTSSTTESPVPGLAASASRPRTTAVFVEGEWDEADRNVGRWRSAATARSPPALRLACARARPAAAALRLRARPRASTSSGWTAPRSEGGRPAPRRGVRCGSTLRRRWT